MRFTYTNHVANISTAIQVADANADAVLNKLSCRPTGRDTNFGWTRLALTG